MTFLNPARNISLALTCDMLRLFDIAGIRQVSELDRCFLRPILDHAHQRKEMRL
jgi:hypothetical protein